ncbi:aspartate aminotransferase [Halogranum amylolyticum]|uniref:Aminotransferase n=1 Tax=Halogranum amylolyticum TaxID=660520 RepID=A0A1H8WB50_9EURY|nr:pyridoxal phosphate-dependent aminotransferase [Halogranum amylolyticum]SEP24860.1 aspartate aminotransferase [Halogranum amylolyticum]
MLDADTRVREGVTVLNTPAQIAERVEQFEESKIRVMFDLAEEHEGDLVRLEVGEPDFDTPQHIVSGAMDAAHDGATHYTSNAGLPEVREAIANKMADENYVHVDPESELVVTNGAMEALLLAMLAVVNPGDDVLIPTPGWPNYSAQATLAGAKPVEVPMSPEDDFDLDADRVIDAMSSDTAAVLLNTPCNPTGRDFDREEIQRVTDAVADYNAYLIADEVYEGLVYDGSSEGIASYVDHPERVLTVNGCSKKYAMTGWRLGWLAGDETVIDTTTTIHQSTTSCASSVSQHAALTALTGDQSSIEEMYDVFERRRDFVVDRIAEIPGVSCPRPNGAIYVFLDVSEFEGSSMEIAKKLLNNYGVVTAPGSGFGDVGEGYLRLSFANSLDELEKGLNRIEEMAHDELGD